MNKFFAFAILVAAGAPAAAQSAGQPVEIPLTMQGGRLVVPVKSSNGNELSFALTTGTPMTVFSRSGATRAGHDTELTLGGLPVPTDRVHTGPDADLMADGRVLDGMIAVFCGVGGVEAQAEKSILSPVASMVLSRRRENGFSPP